MSEIYKENGGCFRDRAGFRARHTRLAGTGVDVWKPRWRSVTGA